MTRRATVILAVLTVLAVLGASGCGVGTEDRPQPIEETSIPRTPAIPSVASEPATSPSTPPSTTAPPPATPSTAAPPGSTPAAGSGD